MGAPLKCVTVKKTLTFKSVACSKNYENKFDKFCLMLWKGVYLYEYMDSWQRFDEKPLLDKKEFYSSLTMEDITDGDFKHAERVWEDFKIRNLGEYHD